jgi:hypothetical protein
MESDFERKLRELGSGAALGFVVRSESGAWELSRHQPPLGSGPYLERLSNGTVRKWNNQATSDMSYTDL